MCGLAGYIGKKKISEKIIKSTLRLMKHRGPDSQNYRIREIASRNCLLLHSRLNIIDLNKRSDQPFSLDNYDLIFNGEIYNYIELKNFLASKGIFCTTNSDTEVLLRCFILLKESCFQKFEGMWSIVIVDKKENKIIFSRDRFGEKPLYIYEDSSGFYFGSESKFIQELLQKKLEVNYDFVKKYLFLGYKSLFKKNESFFKRIKQVPAGTFLSYKNDQKDIKNYWKLKNNTSHLSTKEIIDTTKDLLINSIKIRLRSDVPVAICLSGGIDSAAIVSISRKILNKDVKSYSIIDKDDRYNELENIKKIVKDTDCESEFIYLKKNTNFLENLKKLIIYHNAPIATITWYIHSLLIKKIHQDGRKVSLSGTAADEMFAGYYDHYLLHLYECFKSKKNFQKNLKNWKEYVSKNVRNKFLKNPKLYIHDSNFRDHIFDEHNYVKSFSKKSIKHLFQEKKLHESLMKNRMMNEIFYETTPVILNQDDLNSMYYSVENRSPFLDKNLYEFCLSIPASAYINNGYNKYVLRESMKNIIQEDVRLDRKKKGFNASINSLINLKDKKITNYIFDSNSPINNICNVDLIKKYFENNKKIPNHMSKFLFNFINTKIFLENIA